MDINSLTSLGPDTGRLFADLTTLAGFVEPGTPGITRRFPSAAYQHSRAWLQERMKQAGLATHIDAGGNLFGQRAGLADLPPILIGSHTDTVYAGGRYDGALGVIGALEVARCLGEAGVNLRHPLVIADYLAEEATDFGVSCIGSRALTGALQPEWLNRTLGGQTLAEAIAGMGGQPEALAQAALKPGSVTACLELHIEQGPVLESQAIALGAVSGIVAIRRGSFELRGQPDHAGTTPMQLRHDALTAAAALVLELEQRCRAEPGAVGTVGKLEVHPNQSNVVPGTVWLTAELRHLQQPVIDRLWPEFCAAAEAACVARGVVMSISTLTNMEPMIPPAWLLEEVLSVCRSLDPAAITLPSGAGHDSSHLAHIAPAAMIFVPSIGGRSHCPEEDTAPEHLALGLAALAQAVVMIDQRT